MQWEQLLLCWRLNKIGKKKSIYDVRCFLEWRSSIPGHAPHFKPPPRAARERFDLILDFQLFEGRGSVWFALAHLAAERKNAQIWAFAAEELAPDIGWWSCSKLESELPWLIIHNGEQSVISLKVLWGSNRRRDGAALFSTFWLSGFCSCAFFGL